MKLSEAIRLGAMLRPQAFGYFFTADGSCAMGAASEALGINNPGHENVSLTTAYSWLCRVVAHPSGSQYGKPAAVYKTIHGLVGGVTCVIATLNDHDHWTRERIADWIATIEPAEVSQTKPVEEGVWA